MKEKDKLNQDKGRRKFIQTTAAASAGLALVPSLSLNSQNKNHTMEETINARGYAGTDAKSPLKSWNFERRPLGDNDVLIEIKYSGICHSDIHQIQGHWGPQKYPQVPGHEIAGIITAVGKNVSKFKVGDKAGIGCMVDGCTTCENEEQYHPDALYTYGNVDEREPTGITQGGYSNNIVVRDHYAIKIPETLELKYAAPLLCAGITTYSPLMKYDAMKKDEKVGVIGIGGLGHLAVKLAVSKGAEVYAFTTSADKVEDIKGFGAKEVVVVNSSEDLKPWKAKLDYMISTVPYAYEMSPYIDCVKPYGYFTQVGQPIGGALEINNFNMIYNRVNFNGSLIGGIKDTQEVVDYCAENNIYPQIEMINADEINDAWKKVVDKKARYRYVIDAATF